MKNALAATPNQERRELATKIRKLLRNARGTGFMRLCRAGIAPDASHTIASLIELDALRNGLEELAEELTNK